jgi:hypothetical protein
VRFNSCDEFDEVGVHIAAANQREMALMIAEGMHDMGNRAQQVVHAVLRAHHAEVDAQVRSSALEGRIGLHTLESAGQRSAAYHRDSVGRNAPAFHRHAPIRFVGGNHSVGGAVGLLLQPQQAFVEQVAPIETRLVQLGAQIVLVEHELDALAFVPAPNKPEGVGRVAGLNHIEAALAPDAPRQSPSLQPAVAELVEEAHHAFGGRWHRVAVQMYAVKLHVFRLVFGTRRDDRHFVARFGQRERLLPHAPVHWHGQILH